MGSKRIGIKPSGQADFEYGYVPREMMKFVAQECGVKTFVETGTEYGNTAMWAALNFEKVYTIEASKHFQEFAENRFMEIDRELAGRKYRTECGEFLEVDDVPVARPTLFRGESREMLPGLIHNLSVFDSVMWWLDSHFTHAEDSGNYHESEKHPLLDELDAITRRLPTSNFIFIDDVRFIVYPFTPPGSTQPWPSLANVMSRLVEYTVAIYGDSIVAIPRHRATLLDDWKKAIKGGRLDVL